MTHFAVLWSSFGTALGALCRYLISKGLSRLSQSDFPWGTWVVNVAGTFLLGLTVHHWMQGGLLSNWRPFLDIGFFSGFTTFSTISLEALRLYKTHPRLAYVYVGSSLFAGLAAAWLALS